jgi:hypothetical protein
VRDVPAEIDLGRHELAIAHGVHFGIPEPLARRCRAFINDECMVALLDFTSTVEGRDGGAVRPANLKIRFAVQCVIDRTGK